MKKHVVTILTLLIVLDAAAQKKHFIYHLDKDLIFTEPANAVILGKGIQDSDVFNLECFSKKDGKLLMKIHFTDSSLQVLEGSFLSFYPSGQVESAGHYHNDLKEGAWINYDSSGLKIDSLNFKEDQIISSETYNYGKNKLLERKLLYDVKADHYISNNFKDGKLESRAESFGDSGTITFYNEGKINIRPWSSVTALPAEFPGGLKEFRKYFMNSIDMRSVRGGIKPNPGNYAAEISFIINRTGTLSSIRSKSDMGFGFNEEAIRVLKNSPAWKPALRSGIPVNSKIEQVIAFTYSSDGELRYDIY